MTPFKRIVFTLLSLVLLASISGCTTDIYTVFITPPNYGIIINLNDPSSQATSNNLENGTLMTVAQQRVNMKPCVVNMANKSSCPDAMVVEVPGAYVTRIYTTDANSGTSENKQSLCFEANGANGCVDFTITAQVLRDNAKCYANRVGIKPVGQGDEARFHFRAVPLDNYKDENGVEQPGTLDNRVIGVASGIFSQAVTQKSPLTMALEKYGLFNNVKQQIIDTIFKQTCITIKPDDMYISNGIVWSDQTIQDQINQATILANQLELLKQKNELQKQQSEALLDRAKVYEKECGTACALEFLRIQTDQLFVDKWTGQGWIPFFNQATPDYVPTPLPSTPAAPVTTPQ